MIVVVTSFQEVSYITFIKRVSGINIDSLIYAKLCNIQEAKRQSANQRLFELLMS